MSLILPVIGQTGAAPAIFLPSACNLPSVRPTEDGAALGGNAGGGCVKKSG